MLHQGDAMTTGTQIVFGDNALPSYPYDAGKTDNRNKPEQRQFTSLGDRFDVQITAIEPVPGDYNGDGVVGADDHGMWRASFGNSVTPGAGADGNNNGVVDAADYVFWRNQSQPTPGNSADDDALRTSQPMLVPEPSTVITACMVAVLFTLSLPVKRRGRQSKRHKLRQLP
jgi:hypothetical protein